MRHPCQTCHHHAQRHPVGTSNPWRACLNSLLFTLSFFVCVEESMGAGFDVSGGRDIRVLTRSINACVV